MPRSPKQALSYRLTEDEIRLLQKPLSGQGGWQKLLKSLRDSIRGTTIHIKRNDFDTLVRYAPQLFKSGGWQRRIPVTVGRDVLCTAWQEKRRRDEVITRK